MKEEVYNEIIEVMRTNYDSPIASRRKLHTILTEKFPDVPENTLKSIFNFYYQRKTKADYTKHLRKGHNIYSSYLKAVNKGAPSGILLRMAEDYDIPPNSLARIILEKHYEKLSETDETVISSKSFISKIMKDTTLIKDKVLAYETFLCILHDDQYGIIAACVNNSIGQEYEYKLHRKVEELNLPYRNEEQMRLKGYDKTPDVRLEVPFAVDGFIVNWIESKALFGDKECHHSYFRDQFLSYWNRFGTGLVIYWFGHLDYLEKISEQKIIIRDHFPEDIVMMNPSSIKPKSILL